jgi:S-adenosylmethionine:tRNA ribosyltransferase-isomerase
MRVLTHGAVGTAGSAPTMKRERRLGPRAPLELTGSRRDAARLLVAHRTTGDLVVATMADLPRFLDAGDVVVVNTSATRPAAIVAADPRYDDLVVHLSTEQDEPGEWVVEPRHDLGAGTSPWLDFTPSGPIALPGDATVELLAPYTPAGHWHRPTAAATPSTRVRLWRARLRLPVGVDEYLARFGRPIRYGHEARAWPLEAYQTVFATVPGSVEMPSAARGFTPELVTRLVSQGVVIAPITLHCGVASPEADETPYPERFAVPSATAAAVNHARVEGHRVIAVGTTATRALETVAHPSGLVCPGTGWTDLVITPERGVWAVDGLISGWHDPEASHLLLVEAVAGRQALDRSYDRAVAANFHGHEFGDFHLILP